MAIATKQIDRMLRFGIESGLVDPDDYLFMRNQLLDLMQLPAPQDLEPDGEPLPSTLTSMLDDLAQIAVTIGSVENSADAMERFTAKLAGVITPSPSHIKREFWRIYETDGPDAATDWFYALCRACDYIKVDQIARNVKFMADSPYGELEITINLSKPEKDPRDIIAQRNAPQLSYPKCMLCVENPGYAGRPGFPARQNHRMVPVELNGHRWYLQYSPYLYYGEHCILLNELHTPMHIDEGNMRNMFSFIRQFPSYFIGSNADLPIVGGSILSHDHFQGGRYVFPMDKAPSLVSLKAPIEGVEADIMRWPMSYLRLRSTDEEKLVRLGAEILAAWREYSDPSLDILAHTDQPHNTITPTARYQHGKFVLNLVPRNNRTTAEHPMGIFHPHQDLHHVKKENIGLIEVMGLFILPGRLLTELDQLADYLTGARCISDAPSPGDPLEKHYDWVRGIKEALGTSLTPAAAKSAIQDALAKKCTRVLEDAGVYKLTPAHQAGFVKFLNTVGFTEF